MPSSAMSSNRCPAAAVGRVSRVNRLGRRLWRIGWIPGVSVVEPGDREPAVGYRAEHVVGPVQHLLTSAHHQQQGLI